MSKLWELTKYVEENPDSSEHRWRLAKKLYATWEYRMALEHLQILCNDLGEEVTPNLFRYLTATYYRLDRYDECLKTLELAIERWPNEIGLLEQKAKTLKSLKRYREAASVWENVFHLDPENTIAKQAAQAMHKMAGADEMEEHSGSDIDQIDEKLEALLDLNDMECPECSAPNNQESKACWRCGLRFGEPVREPSLIERIHGELPDIPWRGVSGIALFLLTGLAVYVSWPAPPLNALPPLDSNLSDFWLNNYDTHRFVIGALLLLGWPLSLYLTGLTILEEHTPDPVDNILGGAILAVTTYVCLWIPSTWFWVVPVIPGVVLGGIFSFTVFDLRGFLAAAHWGMHLVLVAVILAVAASITLGPGSLLAPLGLLKLSKSSDESRTWSHEGNLPKDFTVQWQSSGSTWLDKEIGQAAIEVNVSSDVSKLTVGLYASDDATVQYESTDKELAYFDTDNIQTGKVYNLKVECEPGAPGAIRIWGMLPVTVSPAEKP